MIDTPHFVSALTSDWDKFVAALGPPAASRRTRGAAFFGTGIPAAPLNCIFLNEPDTEAGDVEGLLDFAVARNVPHCLQLRPASTPELVNLAKDRGMSLAESVPLMVLDPSAVGLLEKAAAVEGLEIRELRAEERAVHISLMAEGFEAPRELFDQLMAPGLVAHPGAHMYIGEVGGTPVTTAFAFFDGDHVGIYNVATPEAHRRQGYGAAVTARAILDGFRVGAEFAYLQSSAAGLGVYEGLGFKTVETWDVWVSNH